MNPDIDFTEEEELLLKALYKVSRGLRNSSDRKIETIRNIAVTGRAEVDKCRELLRKNRSEVISLGTEESEKFLGYINDRFVVLCKSTNLPLFRKKTVQNLNDGIRPRIEDVISDSHLMEIIFGNLYMSVSHFNSLQAGEAPQELGQKLLDVVQLYEQTRAIDGVKGQYRSDPPGRAQLCYAFEMLVEKPNVFQRVSESEDYSVLYGREGLNLQVKNERFFDVRGRKTIQNVHLHALYRQHTFCFPEPIRLLVMDCIPVYGAEKIPNPAVYS